MLGNECFGFRNELCLSAKDKNLPGWIKSELWRQFCQKEKQKLWSNVSVLGISVCPPKGTTQSGVIHLGTKVLVAD
jgi:hypothetical protein